MKRSNWVLNNALRGLQVSADMRMTFNCKRMNDQYFMELYKMNFLINRGHKDMNGHPILYLVAKNMHLKKISEEFFNRFICYIIDGMCANMEPHIDNLVLIIDCHKFGYKNWSKSHFKSVS